MIFFSNGGKGGKLCGKFEEEGQRLEKNKGDRHSRSIKGQRHRHIL